MASWRHFLLLAALQLGAFRALRRFPEEEDFLSPQRPSDVSFSTEEDLEDLPDWGEGADEPLETKVGKEHTAALRDTPFKNVLLVVHCRLMDSMPGHVARVKNSAAVCQKRFPLFRSLGQFFPEIVFWSGEVDCPGGDISPHYCIADQLLKRATDHDRAGIFYMHFDALVRPEVLKHTFDPWKIGVFNEHDHCDVADGCHWLLWERWREPLEKSLEASAAKGFPVEYGKLWHGVDDLFYMPKRVFSAYGELQKHFQVHHEVAGPTMWRILARYTNVSIQSLGCTGGCCEEVFGWEALEPGFRCGHPFRLSRPETRSAFKKAQLMD